MSSQAERARLHLVEQPTVNAARVFPAFDDRGTLNIGAPADVTIMELQEGTFEFLDNYKALAPATSGFSP